MLKVTAPLPAGWEEKKQRILDEFVSATGHNRTYAPWLLSKQGKRVVVSNKGADSAAVEIVAACLIFDIQKW